MSEIEITPFQLEDIPAVKLFCDRWIGDNYYGEEDLEIALLMSAKEGECASFIAWARNERGRIPGAMRLSYAPGVWIDERTRGVSPELWPCAAEDVASFKSLFVAESLQGQGLGPRLSELSLKALKNMGARAVICHSWLQSPGNTSQRYLQKMGFRPVREHLKFWFDVDYQCPVCAPERCVCTALEMIKEL